MLIVLFFLVQAGLIWYAIDSARNTAVESVRRNTVATSELGSLAVLAQQIRRYEKEYFVWVANREKRDAYEREWRDALGKVDALLAGMATGRDGAFTAQDIEQVAAWAVASAYYAAEMEKIFLAVAQRSASVHVDHESGAGAAPATYRPDEANDMIKAGKDRLAKDLIKGVTTMSEAKAAATLALAGATARTFDSALAGVMVSVVIGVIIALMLSIGLPGMVTKAIDRLSVAAEEMSKGNLTQAYDAGGVVEFVRLAEALNRMRLGQLALVERLRKRQ